MVMTELNNAKVAVGLKTDTIIKMIYMIEN